ncbi:hypothetical protein [Methanothrix soehngenii]|jgi:hypothetical protein|uniref:hypothetical protein n=1 Tax=Methanothrix soehngenii TaxID=2223 RepID=UPI00138AF294|nr:hypothetical protein [Methanothrix soehngenii]
MPGDSNLRLQLSADLEVRALVIAYSCLLSSSIEYSEEFKKGKDSGSSTYPVIKHLPPSSTYTLSIS